MRKSNGPSKLARGNAHERHVFEALCEVDNDSTFRVVRMLVTKSRFAELKRSMAVQCYGSSSSVSTWWDSRLRLRSRSDGESVG